MMKNRLLIIALLLGFVAFAQQTASISINWTENTVFPYGKNPLIIPAFDSGYMDFDTEARRLMFVANMPVAQLPDEASLEISGVVYENITREQLGDLDPAVVPAALNAKLYASQARESFYAVLQFNPIIKDGSSFKRVKSFRYTYKSAANTGRTLNTNEVVNSVLSSGQWYKFYVQKSGVYRLTRAFLNSLGFDTSVDPRKIKIYGNGGRMAPLLNATDYPLDPEENAIRVVGEDDGEFGAGDYILFYAEGVDNWNAESGTNNNLYSDKAYYYITSAGSANGKRIQENVQPTGAATQTTGVFDDYEFHERDLVSIARLGRKWHGEAFNVENEQEFDFTVPDIVTTSPVTVAVSAAAYSDIASSMTVAANAASVGTLSFSASTSTSHNLGADGTGNLSTFNAAGSEITIKLTYNNNGNPSANAWLDYIVLQAKRNLRGNGKQFRFRLNSAGSSTGVLQYDVTNASSIAEVWDITDIYNATSVVNDGQASFSFKAALGEVRQYITVVPGDYYIPLRDGTTRMANQNLKGTILKNSQGQFQDVEYIIVTPAFLSSAAETLANLHRNLEGMTVKVVTLEDIYAEFSTGQQDIAAIRNFIKYVYNNASSTSGRLKYVCLFGDTSFDYKNRIPGNTNIVPSFHAYRQTGDTIIPNYNEVNTFISDDFYGMMDGAEGRIWSASEKADIAIGRMLVSDIGQANDMVTKVQEYFSEDSYGKWRNEYITLVDDLDGDGSLDFVNYMEEMVASANTNRPSINFKKFYIDAWVQEASSGGDRYPEAKEEFLRAINYGALIVNYLGHGSIRAMASERMFEATDAQNLTNQYRYPLFITATCELTKFDNPYEDTTGEEIYWNPKGGAIAMVTTTRALYISDARSFNNRYTEKLYAYGLPYTDYPTMAEALRMSKAEATNTAYRPIAFVGDPALKLAIPRPNIVLTEINDVPVAQSTEVLEALSFVRLGGRVTDESNNVLTNYNGELEVTVYDKPIDRQTLANDTGDEDDKIDFTTLGEAVFRGNATVTNGQFEFGFIVPRDIRIPVGEGRVSFYAKKNNTLEDQAGYDATIKIGGINENAAEDTTPPTVRLYMNDESFVSGGITNSSPMLLAILYDEHGINTASGIGHDIIGILDGDDTNPYVMNDFYETANNDYTNGTVRFPFVNLEKGLHTLQFKAWDVYNNLVTAEIQFVVAGDEGVALDKVLNYPNPFVSYTEFWFTHNRPFEPLDVQVQVFTVTGKIVKTINQQVTTDGFLSRDLKWDGRDDFGDKIGKGVYVYKLTVRSTVTGKTAEKYEKLVLL
jgi:Peptidase family C25